MARITLTVDEQVIYLETGRGRGAYESYFRTTTDNPKLTEAQWAAQFAISQELTERVAALESRVDDMHDVVRVKSTDW